MAHKLGRERRTGLVIVARHPGCLTPAGLHDMRRGQSPTITLGPYTGDQLSVDHTCPQGFASAMQAGHPFSVAPQLDKVIANLELMPLRLNLRQREALGLRQLDLRQRLRHAGWRL